MTTVSRADIDERVAQRLAEHDIRYTAGRRLTARALVGRAGPATAAQLHDELGSEVPLSSLYRTLSLFDRAGINERSHDPDGVARYELAEWLLGHHHHLVCNTCGEVEDVELDADAEAQLADIVRAIADGSGYHATGHRIDVEGVCGSCRD